MARGLAGAFFAGGCALEGREGDFSVLDWELFAAKTPGMKELIARAKVGCLL